MSLWDPCLHFSVDHSRVKLQAADDDETSDYINANYMPVSKHSIPGVMHLQKVLQYC